MKDSRLEGHAEEQLVLVDVAKQLKRVRVRRTLLAEDGPRLEDELVGAKVVALEERELVLVREVEGPLGVFEDAKVERLDARRARVRAGVAGGEELGPPEPGLAVEDGGVADCHLDGDSVDVELFFC